MIEFTTINHYIQKYILSILIRQKVARFRDMRPPKTDTNLYSYHLKRMIKDGFVEKTGAGYTLGQKGILYGDRVSTGTFTIRPQPKIIIMLVVQNSNGDVLLYKKDKQPFLDVWNLPQGKVHVEDASLRGAAQREAQEKLDISVEPQHAGDCYIRMKADDEVVMSTMVHVFRAESDDVVESSQLHWARPHKLTQYELAPAVLDIITRTFFRDEHYFEEYEVPWYD